MIYFTDLNTCTAPSLDNGSVSPDSDSSVGTALMFACNTGYHLSTSTSAVVCNNGESGNTANYEGDLPTCGKIAFMILLLGVTFYANKSLQNVFFSRIPGRSLVEISNNQSWQCKKTLYKSRRKDVLVIVYYNDAMKLIPKVIRNHIVCRMYSTNSAPTGIACKMGVTKISFSRLQTPWLIQHCHFLEVQDICDHSSEKKYIWSS